MNFYFYTNTALEEWDYNNSVKEGIGGSETSIVEMSWRLARRGHKVTIYAPIKRTTKPQWRETTWLHFKKATFKEDGIWILYRCPEILDKFKNHTNKQIVWLLWQDWDYPTLTKERSQYADHHITLCKSHGKYILDKYPYITKNQLWLSSNGIKVDLIEEIEKENIKRNPYRIMYASSPDRGLKAALLILRKAREYVPELELHAYYGFNNIDKITKGKMVHKNHFLMKAKKELLTLTKQTKNAHFHGRISQPELYREWFKSGIYLYITDFFETSNIASQEAQAMGAVPVFSPIFAQGENIKHGIGVEGHSNEPLVIAKAAAEVVRLALMPELQEVIRKEMIPWARERFNWDNFVVQWEFEAANVRDQFEKAFLFPEQLC